MCGIAGVAGLDLDAGAARALVARMCAAIKHRGPDGDGTCIHADASLGMTRLAIVDVENGKQPMLSGDEQIALVFNGEIYNAPALREGLKKQGIRFRTRSDTEVILRLYERNPDDVEKNLRGMWAFAIHDRRRRRLVLSRDRFGIKPLYIASRGKALAFASEMGALRVLSSELAGIFEVDRASVHAMLSWSYIPGESTIFKGVRKLAPAARLTFDLASGSHENVLHYSLHASEEAGHATSIGDACALVEPVLESAVKEHLESDVPIAAFMSGGIDSSLVAHYAARASTKPITGYAIGFRDRRFDESPFARETALKIGISLEVTILDEDAVRASLADALAAYDEPFGDSSSLATYLVSSVVGKTHKVALGGDGGDEVFAGYRKHGIIGVREMLGAPLRETIAGVLSHVPARTDRTSRLSETLRVARRLARGLHGGDAAAYLALTQIAPLERTAALVNAPIDDGRFEEPILDFFSRGEGGQLRQTLASDLANVLPNDMLTKVDRASMARHLEARVPLLDHRLVEIGLGLSPKLTLRSIAGKGGKRVLRALHERHFGRELASRKKQGFGVPVERWLRGPLERAAAHFFSAKELDRFGLLSVKALGNDGWRTWRKTDAQILWNCFALAAWCELVLGDGAQALHSLM